MPVIDIDFEVYKALTMKRETESHSYNDVLREMLGLEGPQREPKKTLIRIPKPGAAWVSKGVTFPDGTDFRATYKGQVFAAKINRGRLIAEGDKRATSLSQAARLITNNSVDGWTFWEVKRPGDLEWRKAGDLRKVE
ncbi:MAG: hypothetical protein EOS50_05335 [Mesorhizobium sp.]|nr:MAG: hypothetical protein EOS50_05335 [Mesorhizobium sp.]